MLNLLGREDTSSMRKYYFGGTIILSLGGIIPIVLSGLVISSNGVHYRKGIPFDPLTAPLLFDLIYILSGGISVLVSFILCLTGIDSLVIVSGSSFISAAVLYYKKPKLFKEQSQKKKAIQMTLLIANFISSSTAVVIILFIPQTLPLIALIIAEVEYPLVNCIIWFATGPFFKSHKEEEERVSLINQQIE